MEWGILGNKKAAPEDLTILEPGLNTAVHRGLTSQDAVQAVAYVEVSCQCEIH